MVCIDKMCQFSGFACVFSAEDVSEHFERKPISTENVKRTSALSKQLENSADMTNCFMEYAKYDGRVRSNFFV